MSSPPRVKNGAAPLSDRLSSRLAHLIAFAVFLCAAGTTLHFCYSMSGGMLMPGNWTMSMIWMPMGSEVAAGAMFTAMWLAMMVAMMLPSTMPTLLLYRRAAAFRGENNPSLATLALAGGYFFVWTLFGLISYVIGVLITRTAMHSNSFSRALPLVTGLSLCIAGIYQLTPWKSVCLKHCRDPLTFVAQHFHERFSGAFRLGLHHGIFCAACCWALMLIQLVLGVMNLAVMVAVAAVIALEKLVPNGLWFARVTGLAAIAGGIVMAAFSIRAP